MKIRHDVQKEYIGTHVSLIIVHLHGKIKFFEYLFDIERSEIFFSRLCYLYKYFIK